MQKPLTITLLLALLSLGAFALPQGAGTHVNDASYVQSELVHRSILLSFLPSFSVGTFTTSGTFDKDWLLGETMNVRFDETSFNVICDRAKFVFEFYQDGQFKLAKRTGEFGVKGSQHFSAFMPVETNELGVGNFEVIDYLYCADSDFEAKNVDAKSRIINKCGPLASVGEVCSQTFQIRAKAICDTSLSPNGNVGSPHCEDGSIVQDIRTDCELSPQLVSECKFDCIGNACVNEQPKIVPQVDSEGNAPPRAENNQTSFEGGLDMVMLALLLVVLGIFVYAVVKGK